MKKIFNRKINDYLYLFLNSISIDNTVSITDYHLSRDTVRKKMECTTKTLVNHLNKLESEGFLKIDKEANKILLKEKIYAPKKLWDKLMEPNLYRGYIFLLTIWDKPVKSFSKTDMALAFGYTKTSRYDGIVRQKINSILQSLKDSNIISYEVQGNYHILTHLEQ